jgi:MFS family permease
MTASLPVLVVVASFLINRQGRKIVEEDSAKAGMEQSAMTGLRSIYILGGMALFSFLLVMIGCVAIEWFATLTPVSWYWGVYVYLFFVLIFLPLFYFAVRMSKDQEHFAKYPPRLPNLLSILTGEEKAPKGRRNRINLMGDLIGIGLGLFSMHVLLFSYYFHTRGIKQIESFGISFDDLYIPLLSSIVLIFLMFAVFFAGIPRRRYWGMIFLGISMLPIDTVVHLMFSDALYPHYAGILWIAYGFSFWYLLCFTLLGVGGLFVFRKRKTEPQS